MPRRDVDMHMSRRDVASGVPHAPAAQRREPFGGSLFARTAVVFVHLSLLPSAQGYHSSGAMARPGVWGGKCKKMDSVDSVSGLSRQAIAGPPPGQEGMPSSLDFAGQQVDWRLHPAISAGVMRQTGVQHVYGLRRCESLRDGMHKGEKTALYQPAHSRRRRRLTHDSESSESPPSYRYEGDANKLTRIQMRLYPSMQF